MGRKVQLKMCILHKGSLRLKAEQNAHTYNTVIGRQGCGTVTITVIKVAWSKDIKIFQDQNHYLDFIPYI